MLNANIEWKLIGNVTGANSISYPANAKELLCSIWNPTGNRWHSMTIVPEQNGQHGIGQSQAIIVVTNDSSNRTITLTLCASGTSGSETDKTSVALMYLYYK